MARKPSSAGASGIKGSPSDDIGQPSGRADDTTAGAFQELPSGPSQSLLVCATLTDAERGQLLDWTRSRTLPHRQVIRSQIILLAADGLSVQEIADRLHVSPATVRLWCRRFNAAGVTALERDQPGRGRRPGRSITTVLATLQAMRTRAPQAPRWTSRTLAAAAGTSPASVWRIWQHYGVGPGSAAPEIERAIARAITESRSPSK